MSPRRRCGKAREAGLLLLIHQIPPKPACFRGEQPGTITELGWDIRKPGTDLSAGPRGSHCGAGAPRWNIQTRDGRFFFLGCNSPPTLDQHAGIGFVRMRWGGSVPLFAFEVPSFRQVDIRGLELKSLEIVFDEG